MLVMDDGWFGKRNKDDSSLGDWVVNEEKIKGGLKNLVDKVNEIGLEFGIWFEPEMISRTLISTESTRNGRFRFREEKRLRSAASTCWISPARRCRIMRMNVWQKSCAVQTSNT